MRSEREKGGDYAPGDSKGRSPWRAFGDFPRDGKVTQGGGAERPPRGGCGGAAPTSGSAGGLRPLARKPQVPHPPAVEREKTEVKGPPPFYMEGVPRGQKLLRHRRIFVVNFSRKLCKKR